MQAVIAFVSGSRWAWCCMFGIVQNTKKREREKEKSIVQKPQLAKSINAVYQR